MIYAGGEFSFDKILKFSYPATSSRLRALTKVILMIYRYRDMISTSWMRGRFPLARKSSLVPTESRYKSALIPPVSYPMFRCNYGQVAYKNLHSFRL